MSAGTPMPSAVTNASRPLATAAACSGSLGSPAAGRARWPISSTTGSTAAACGASCSTETTCDWGSTRLLRERHGDEFAKRFGLGFAAQDREENIRRIGAVAELFAQAGIVTLTAFISPYRRDRDAVRAMLAPGDFVEIHVRAPLEVCESRDPKGLYKKARAGEIKGFTGIDDPYEEPLSPELVVDSAVTPAEQLADQVIAWLEQAGKIPFPYKPPA